MHTACVRGESGHRWTEGYFVFVLSTVSFFSHISVAQGEWLGGLGVHRFMRIVQIIYRKAKIYIPLRLFYFVRSNMQAVVNMGLRLNMLALRDRVPSAIYNPSRIKLMYMRALIAVDEESYKNPDIRKHLGVYTNESGVSSQIDQSRKVQSNWLQDEHHEKLCSGHQGSHIQHRMEVEDCHHRCDDSIPIVAGDVLYRESSRATYPSV